MTGATQFRQEAVKPENLSDVQKKGLNAFLFYDSFTKRGVVTDSSTGECRKHPPALV